MSINRIGAAVERKPNDELIPLDEIAERFGVHTDTFRRWIKLDLDDGRNRVPGARGFGSRYIVIRAIFECAMRDGVEPDRTPEVVAPDLDHVIGSLRSLAAHLESVTTTTRRKIVQNAR